MNEFERLKKLYELISPCKLCPLNCNSERLKNQLGICNANLRVKISASVLYPGEEPPLSGQYGSGTIFFSFCNLKCVYCQNFQFSQLGNGRFVSVLELSKLMLDLQTKGASNINLVTPTHYFPQVASALLFAKNYGLSVPVVLNTSGYESVEVLRLMEGLIDIFLTDFRYIDDEKAVKYSSAPNYVSVATNAVKEMLRQIPEVRYSDKGIMIKGVVIRILVFPNGLNDVKLTLSHIASEFGKDVHISLMSQYIPVYKAKDFSEISRKLTKYEILQSVKVLKEQGFKNGWVQYE